MGKKKARRAPVRHPVPGRPARSAYPAGWEAAKPAPGRSATLQARIVGSSAWLSRVEDTVVTLVNTERRRRGLPSLRVDEALNRAARAHSEDMAARGYLSHVTPEGRTAEHRMLAAGYAHPASENLAQGHLTPHAVLHGWMASPGHRANIVDPTLKAIGVGVAQTPQGPYWTQNFGYW